MGALLSLQGVEVIYRRGRSDLRALTSVSLDIAAGEVVAVLALRTQDKSTLLRVAAGMQQPDAGRVLLEGEDLWCVRDAQRQRLLREGVGVVASCVPDIDLPVIERLITLLLVDRQDKGVAAARARDALERVGALECAGQHWDDLSEWERALVAIAVGIVREPRLLIVNDLTSPLGLDETDEVTRLLHDVSKERGIGVLMGISNGNATEWADRIGTLAGGELLMSPDCEEEPEGERGELVRLRDNRRRIG